MLMYENALPKKSVILGYRDYEYVFLWNLLFMLGDSINLLHSDDKLSFYYEGLLNRAVELCDFPSGSRNSDMKVVCLDVD